MKKLPRIRLFSASLSLAVLASPAVLPVEAAPVFRDDMAQRVQACTACHGSQDRVTAEGYYPRIAGKPSGYLYNQLLNFRDGRRSYRLMAQLLDPLSDAYLREMADHFAALDGPDTAAAPVAVSAQELRRGAQLALQGDASRQVPACVQCHGQALTGVQPAIPGLMGLPRDYLNAQLGAWRTGLRRASAPDCMATIARRLSPEDVAAVSGWLVSQPRPADARPAKALPAPLPMRCGRVSAGQPASEGRP